MLTRVRDHGLVLTVACCVPAAVVTLVCLPALGGVNYPTVLQLPAWFSMLGLSLALFALALAVLMAVLVQATIEIGVRLPDWPMLPAAKAHPLVATLVSSTPIAAATMIAFLLFPSKQYHSRQNQPEVP